MSHRIARLALAGLLAPALALLLAMPTAFAQIPRPHKTDGTARKIYNTLDGNRYLATASFMRVKTLDANGNGDFSTLHDAMAWFAALPACPSSPPFPGDCRSGFSRYILLVYPGDGTNNSSVDGYNYTEACSTSTPVTVPEFVSIQGLGAANIPGTNYGNAPVFKFTGTAGTCLSVAANQTALVNLDLKVASATLTGPMSVVTVQPYPGGTPSGGSMTMTNVTIRGVNVVDSNSNSLDLLTVAGSGSVATAVIAYNLNTARGGSGVTSGAPSHAVLGTGNGSFVQFGGWHDPRGSAKTIENAGSGTFRLYGVRVNSGAVTATLANSGSGVMNPIGTPYDTSSGTITDEAVRAASVTYTGGMRDLYGTGSPEGVVTAAIGSTYRRTDGGASTSFYVKESGTGNTGWVAK